MGAISILIQTEYESQDITAKDVKKFIFLIKDMTKSKNSQALHALLNGIKSLMMKDLAILIVNDH